MQRIVQTDYMPKSVQQKWIDTLPHTEEEATRQCPFCGNSIPPQKVMLLQQYIRYRPQKCDCEKRDAERQEQRAYYEQRREQLARYAYTWIGAQWADDSLRGKTFANFNPEKQQYAYDVCKFFVDNPSGCLALYGSFGTGKTHLLAAVANALIASPNKIIPCLFTTAPALFRTIQARIQAKENYNSLIEEAVKTPLLVIDDIDKAKWSEFREEIYFHIVDDRIKADRPIAFSTNRLDQLADYVGGAVASRLKTKQVAVEMVGQDYREVL